MHRHNTVERFRVLCGVMYALAIDISDVSYGFGEVRGVSPVGWEGFGSGNGIIAVPLGLEAVLVDFSRICLG